jgi:mono/diheme cytochrome c family protein
MIIITIACVIAVVMFGPAAKAGLKARTTTVGVVVQTFRSAQVTEGASPTEVTERGRVLYIKYGCYQCHGRQGQGSSAGARLAPSPMPLAGFARYVRQPRGEMPPYTARVVTDQELADIHAFLRSVPRPPAVAALPFDE